MKTALWISFYFLSFLATMVLMYFSRDKILEKTDSVPVLNYTQYHQDAEMADSVYTEHIDSLAVVVEGLLTELTEYVSQLQDRDMKLSQKEFEIKKLKQENARLKELAKTYEERKISYNKAQEDKKLQDLVKMLGDIEEEALAPILGNLPDRLVQIFYDKARPKDRSKIFNSLPPERAGKILADIAGGKN